MKDKIKIAIGRGSTCSGCEIELIDINERLLDVLEIAEIVYSPTFMDTKIKDLESMPDGSITLTLYNGPVRNSDDEREAKLLRKKSKIMIAFGSCAVTGGIPGLANATWKDKIFETVYKKTYSTENPDFILPKTKCKIHDRELSLPEFYEEVKSLDEVIQVDYYLPGCPPLVDQINKLIDVVIDFVKGKELPPKGTIIATEEKTVCDECPLERKEKRISRIYRPHEIEIDPNRCFLEQGLICIGPATRAGCGAKCIKANMPCRGCNGPTSAVLDQGASMASAVASMLVPEGKEESLTEEDIKKIVDQIKDPLGTFYRFSLPKSILKKVRKDKEA